MKILLIRCKISSVAGSGNSSDDVPLAILFHFMSLTRQNFSQLRRLLGKIDKCSMGGYIPWAVFLPPAGFALSTTHNKLISNNMSSAAAYLEPYADPRGLASERKRQMKRKAEEPLYLVSDAYLEMGITPG